MSSLPLSIVWLVCAFHDTAVLNDKNETEIIDKGPVHVNERDLHVII